MASWYRKFLKDFATIAEPLIALTKKDRRYEWGDVQQEAFEKIKALVASAPVLARPVFDAQFVEQTDASDTDIGAVLLQVIDGKERECWSSPAARCPKRSEITASPNESVPPWSGRSRSLDHI